MVIIIYNESVGEPNLIKYKHTQFMVCKGVVRCYYLVVGLILA
jgi:hypothetical protein